MRETVPPSPAASAAASPKSAEAASPLATLEQTADFVRRHIGPSDDEIQAMLAALGLRTLEDLTVKAIPESVRSDTPSRLAPSRTERAIAAELRAMSAQNKVCRSFIGMGYYDTFTPPVILRNVLENPGWYTAYTPYQAEIAQGRLEALLNFQTMVIDLTGLPVANASLLDEATAGAEAMHLCLASAANESKSFWVSQDCHPQTIDVVATRARALGVELVVGDHRELSFASPPCGILLQYPATHGAIHDFASIAKQAHAAGALVAVATDLLALALLSPPGDFGADIVLGSSQRFGVPLGFGGPHAAFFATRDEFKRRLPGRIVGVSVDADGGPALRLALQTREQHIRREKATSNICTAQVLLAVIASMYAVYHGQEGIRTIARRVHRLTAILARGLRDLGLTPRETHFFDTITVPAGDAAKVLARGYARGINLRPIDRSTVGVSLDEMTTRDDVRELWRVLSGRNDVPDDLDPLDRAVPDAIPPALLRRTPFLTHPVFRSYHSETEMLRYLHHLEAKDLSLTTSMIPLGSCTMKLNATSEMIPVTWPEFGRIHPFAPADQTEGYRRLFEDLERMLAELTGFHAVSLQPNAGSQGEFAGLLAIRAYHAKRGDAHRRTCLIPASAHGTNPASAAMAGLEVVVVECDERGNIDVEDLAAKARAHRADLAALMVTYPSTHGVFEEAIRKICAIVHENGGQVYMDGANLNAMVGVCRPAELGADVAHLNLHKTFCIPHGGGGPGMGPIGVKEHLAPFLPSHSVVRDAGPANGAGAVSAAPWGSAGILPISWVYIALMGGTGIRKATQVAILNANYVAERLEPHFKVLYRGQNGMVAHECIVDARGLKTSAGIEVTDIAKRLMDFGFHAPTVSFPVPGTLMIEPTESESKGELDRFCDAMAAIRSEIRAIEEGRLDRERNPLRLSPHTAAAVASDEWDRPYPRAQGAFPLPWVRARKFWPAVGRIDNAHGDRNFVCACPPLEAYR
ncbi:MAG: aminomethyl-transferring glycine dehydrogenase [Planctomycetes bacterium]|nr:aminomethyl-transferring glycine dehydrogenase [Planctomycetota bacterium]